mmetsp:Transcript_12108/g.23383  ORF Transcript_12108/g.23383 Transcript_12108/m.23383 type:complete len:180 (-) Transcript_12108:21-560(-)
MLCCEKRCGGNGSSGSRRGSLEVRPRRHRLHGGAVREKEGKEGDRLTGTHGNGENGEKGAGLTERGKETERTTAQLRRRPSSSSGWLQLGSNSNNSKGVVTRCTSLPMVDLDRDLGGFFLLSGKGIRVSVKKETVWTKPQTKSRSRRQRQGSERITSSIGMSWKLGHAIKFRTRFRKYI